LILQLQLITISHIEFGYFLYNRQIMSQLFFFLWRILPVEEPFLP
jgi:hypothetical protein